MPARLSDNLYEPVGMIALYVFNAIFQFSFPLSEASPCKSEFFVRLVFPHRRTAFTGIFPSLIVIKCRLTFMLLFLLFIFLLFHNAFLLFSI